MPPDDESLSKFRDFVEKQGYEFFPISAAAHQGTRELVSAIAGRLSQLPPIFVYEADYVPPAPKIESAEDVVITRDGDLWIVEGEWLARLIGGINFGDYESRMYFDRMLRESGLFERMEAMGIQDGDTVSMYDLEFEYQS